MSQEYGFLVDLRGVKFADGERTWLQAMPLGTYTHPVYGEIKITPERIQRFASNVKNNVRDTDLDVDYDHKEKTTEAAGWIKDAEARPDGLWVAVEWTKSAVEKLKERAYRYFSPEFSDEWVHPKTKTKFQDVLFGGGLTNRPFLKDILPINLSEIVTANTKNEGVSMDPKKVRKLLGLPEDATDEQVQAKIDEGITKLETPDPKDQPKAEPKADDKPPVEPVVEPVLANELKKLNETSPALGAAIQAVLDQNKSLNESVSRLETANKLSEVTIKLQEVSKGKQFAVAPAVLDKVKELALKAPSKLSDDIFTVLGELVNGGLVELGERGGSNPTYESNAVKSFSDKVEATMKANEKLSYADAVEQIAGQNPDLYVQYRNEVYIEEGAK